jgi:hypothetical protein
MFICPLVLTRFRLCAKVAIVLKIITTEQAAETLGVTGRTLRRWLAARRLPVPEKLSINGQTVFNWTPADLARARRVKAQSKPGRPKKR